MGTPARPKKLVTQGPATACVIRGKALGWLNCTCASGAHGVSRNTLGTKNPSACDIRHDTGDISGGTTVPQVARAMETEYNLKVEVHTGSKVCTPAYLAQQLAAGRGAIVQGNCIALVKTPFRSTKGAVNHAVWFNEVRGGTPGDPDEVLVYDSAADGHRAGWGRAATGPAWWPWDLALKFIAALRPWGDSDPRTLGHGRVYCGIFPDTEPHAHLYHGAKRTNPFPDKCTTWNRDPKRSIRVRIGPGSGTTLAPRAKDKAGHYVNIKVGETFNAYQVVTNGALLAGSRVWYGDHNGKWWVHSSGLRGIGK